MTYRQLRERGFKGTKYDAELMIAQGFTLAAATHQQHTVAPFLGKLKVDRSSIKYRYISVPNFHSFPQ